MTAFACVPRGPFRVPQRDDFAIVGAPPQKEIWPEPRERGATVAAIARVLRGALESRRGPAHRGPKPEPQGR